MKTPLGTVYSTNISPDRQTGIGGWNEEEFGRALRRGVSKDGHNLYPAMPYPSYAKVRDDDVAALYAYFMQSVPAVKQVNRDSDIRFPLNWRWPLKLWNLVFLDTVPYQSKTDRSVAWNRGAYLAQALGHCGSCHTPRGVAFQEKGLDDSSRNFLAGAELDGWFASNLRGDHRDGLGRWSEPEIAGFLRIGANTHASAYGSMTEVVNNSTQYLNGADLAALATYLKSLTASDRDVPDYRYDGKVTASQLANRSANSGAKVYGQYCVQCHRADGQGHAPLLAPLAGNPTVLDRHAMSLINVTLNGTQDLVLGGVPAAYPMPGFYRVLSDQEVADVVSFIRGGWNNNASTVTAAEVAKLRKATAKH